MKRAILLLKYFLIFLGSVHLLMLVIAFTHLPYIAYRKLATPLYAQKFQPDCIIFLGGSGMPSADNLMRLNVTAVQAKYFGNAPVILVHPDSGVVMQAMIETLMQHGIDTNRLKSCTSGTNTITQILALRNEHPDLMQKKILFITAPESVLRTFKTFKKAGFKNVDAMPAFENAMYTSLPYHHQGAGGSTLLPDVSQHLNLRYNFWNYYKLEITCLREYTALLYYKLNGWN